LKQDLISPIGGQTKHFTKAFFDTEQPPDFGTGGRPSLEDAGTDHAGLDLVPLLAIYGILERTEDSQKLLEVQRLR